MSPWRAAVGLGFGIGGVIFAVSGYLVWALIWWVCAITWITIRPR